MKHFAKKIFIILFIVFLFAPITYAKTYKILVQSMNDFYTNSPSEYIKFKVFEGYCIDTDLKIEKGSVLNLRITKVTKPKRGKLDSKIYAYIVDYSIPSEDRTVQLSNSNLAVKIFQYTEANLKESAVDVGVSVAGLLVDHITYPINFARGFISPEDGESRLKSGTQTMYEKSVFSYVEKGANIDLKQGQLAIMVLSTKEEE